MPVSVHCTGDIEYTSPDLLLPDRSGCCFFDSKVGYLEGYMSEKKRHEICMTIHILVANVVREHNSQRFSSIIVNRI